VNRVERNAAPETQPADTCGVCRGLFSLAEAPSSDSTICVVTGASTEVHSGTLQLQQGAALMFDGTCSDVHLKDIIFQGPQLSTCMLCPFFA
jgi:hypothetical protein